MQLNQPGDWHSVSHLPPFFATIAGNTFRDLAKPDGEIFGPHLAINTRAQRHLAAHRAAKLQFNSSLDPAKMAGTYSLYSETYRFYIPGVTSVTRLRLLMKSCFFFCSSGVLSFETFVGGYR